MMYDVVCKIERVPNGGDYEVMKTACELMSGGIVIGPEELSSCAGHKELDDDFGAKEGKKYSKIQQKNRAPSGLLFFAVFCCIWR